MGTMDTTSGPLTNVAQRLARLGMPLLLLLALVLAVAILGLVVIAVDALGADTTPVIVAPFRW
jgi:hypothetical protein